ncbi:MULTISPECIES: hypothetical protein [Roseomonadaceae]|uniref:Uncharacterized protein n=1 Tax=Falsiroseomonas oleicola TaxID=2801474 RepID=A0ABS6H4V8_9PROT|nr:hypothetical protein [Roseomonas oleicola]MBU8542410.1 hypothetical protein [Roseomonas oleicola]
MSFLSRIPGLLLSPRATWVAIAAEPAPGLMRSLLPLAAGACLVNLAVAMTRPGGWYTAVPGRGGGSGLGLGASADSLTVHIGLGPAALSYILFMLLGVVLLRRSLRRRAALHGGVQDAAAAQKLAVHAPFAMWIALFLLPLGQGWLTLLAGLHGMAMLAIGAPILMPPSPGEERRWGRAAAFRGLMIAIGTMVLQFALYAAALLIWALFVALRQMPAPGIST